MLRRCFKRQVFTSQSGVYYIIISVAAVGLLGLIGIAIDSARLYTTKRQLQSVVDAAALAGGRLLVQDATLSIDDVRERMLSLIRENLAVMNFPPTEIARIAPEWVSQMPAECDSSAPPGSSLCISVSPDRQTLQVALRAHQKLYIMDLIPYISDWIELGAAARAVNNKLQVVLVLDMSSSMSQSVPNPPTGCSNRLCAAKSAARSFLDLMLPFDEVALVTFAANYTADVEPPTTPAQRLANYANDARVEYPCPDYSSTLFPVPHASCGTSTLVPLGAKGVGGGPDSAERVELSALLANNSGVAQWGNTNIGAGLYKARNLFSGALPPNTIRAIVLMTDGSPYTDLSRHSGPLTSVTDSSLLGYGPTSSYYLQCGDRSGLSSLQQLKQLGFPMPPSEFVQISEPDGFKADQDPADRNNERSRRLRFMDAIVESNLALDAGTIIYTVGLGPPDPTVFHSRLDSNGGAPPPNDTSDPLYHLRFSPFQAGLRQYDAGIGCEWAEQLKVPFLSYLANDQQRMQNPSPLPSGPLSRVDYFWDFPCVRSGAEMSLLPQGRFWNPQDGASLLSAFQQIANDLRTRLDL